MWTLRPPSGGLCVPPKREPFNGLCVLLQGLCKGDLEELASTTSIHHRPIEGHRPRPAQRSQGESQGPGPPVYPRPPVDSPASPQGPLRGHRRPSTGRGCESDPVVRLIGSTTGRPRVHRGEHSDGVLGLQSTQGTGRGWRRLRVAQGDGCGYQAAPAADVKDLNCLTAD